MKRIEEVRQQFPALNEKIYNKPLIYFDNAATTQKPSSVLESLTEGYTHRNANIHRGVHYLSNVATQAHEEARKHIAQFINADSSDEVLFTRGTTESINLVATCFCRRFCIEGDEIVLTRMEHHSNIVPWQMQAKYMGLNIKVAKLKEDGTLDMDHLRSLINEKTKVVSVCHASNVLGTINPIKEIAELAHKVGAVMVVDGAQAIAHRPVDVQALGADFYAFSGHKVYGPTGIGVLYGKRQWLEKMPPYQGGGEMIDHVSLEEGTTYNVLPYKYEAGTPDFIGSVALSKAISYIEELGFDLIMRQEEELLHYCTERLLEEVPEVRILGTAHEKEAVVSFLIGKLHPFDVGTLLDRMGIAIRTGHHCAQPLMERFGIVGTMRASFAFYNTKEEVDAFVEALKKATAMLS